jgi:predicted ATPase
VQEYQRLLKLYAQTGYRMIELPKVSVKERRHFVISAIASSYAMDINQGTKQ